jgi:hypothetical protein
MISFFQAERRPAQRVITTPPDEEGNYRNPATRLEVVEWADWNHIPNTTERHEDLVREWLAENCPQPNVWRPSSFGKK